MYDLSASIVLADVRQEQFIAVLCLVQVTMSEVLYSYNDAFSMEYQAMVITCILEREDGLGKMSYAV